MNTPLWLITLLIAAPLFGADAPTFDITTISGTRYTGVTVTRAEPDGLSISHSDGLAKIPFTELTEEFCAKYGYDPQKAAAAIKQRAVALEKQHQGAAAQQQAALAAQTELTRE